MRQNGGNMFEMKQIFVLLFVLIGIGVKSNKCFSATYYSSLKNDTLYIGNNLIERKFIWNNGNIITYSIEDKLNGEIWINKNRSSDFYIPKQNQNATKSSWRSEEVLSDIVAKHLEISVEYELDQLKVKKVFRVYENSPAIATDLYLKGKAYGTWEVENNIPEDDVKNVLTQQNEIPVLDQVSLDGKHWKLDAIEFLDYSDYNNTLVKPYSGLSYHENAYKGNLLFFQDIERGSGLFFLKEAACSRAQLSYPGADFITKFGDVKVIGLGVKTNDLSKGEWVKAYGSVVGVYSGGEKEKLTALRQYQKNLRILDTERNEFIMMNTWGDRGSTNRLTEDFCIRQIEACAKMGVTHFQLDYGWQQGQDAGGYLNIYDKYPDFWTPNKKLFPDGLGTIIEKGKEQGVKVCLYINPSLQKDNEDWEKDANSIINMYKEYGVCAFKVDGQKMTTKIAEIRTRKMFEKIQKETDGNVFLNLDITAGIRGGYFMYNEYGNIFLENRYTEWGNYYPYWTLRNLWMLSKYYPAERLQMEFLNKWKNQDKYPAGDAFAPKNYSFEYLFATTMASQSLVWMDVADLSDEALSITGKLIKKYQTVRHDFHEGVILPIGDEPSGKSWTGFQSIGKDGKGYFLIFREKNPDSKNLVKVYSEPGTKMTLTPVLGEGTKTRQEITKSGFLSVILPKENSFVLYQYDIE